MVQAGTQPPTGMRQPTPQEMMRIQQQIATEAAKRGMTPQQYVAQIRAQQMQAAQRAQQQGGQQGGGSGSPPPGGLRVPPPQPQQVKQAVQPGPPKPEAIAVANFLKGQDLKQRQCLLQEKRKTMFKVKRAIRALQSPAYEKARTKNPLLPPVTDRATAENTFKLLPLSLLALRVSKVDPHAGHNHGPVKKESKRVKGLWTVKVEQHQETADMHHYIWIYEGSQWKQKAYAALALVLVITVVMFPLWPLKMRLGVWYLSMGMLGLLGLFFAMAIFRLILFCATVFTIPPGLWLYPNLFEDVGFFDSFRPWYGWQETKEDKEKAKEAKKAKKAKKKEKSAVANGRSASPATRSPARKPKSAAAAASSPSPLAQNTASTTGSQKSMAGVPVQRNLHARVEEVEDD